jgi:hypothetical protein
MLKSCANIGFPMFAHDTKNTQGPNDVSSMIWALLPSLQNLCMLLKHKYNLENNSQYKKTHKFKKKPYLEPN